MRPEPNSRFKSSSWSGRRIALAMSVALCSLARVIPSASEPTQQSPAPTTYDSSSFVRELARLKADLEPAGKSADGLRAYRESLPKTWSVDAGARRFEVRTDALSSRLDKAEKQPEVRRLQLEQAREYLDSLAAETASLSGQAQSSSGDARFKLDSILSRPEYKHVRRPKSWYERIRDRIEEILDDALDRIFGKIGGQKSLGYALLWIGVVGAAILIAYWAFQNWFRGARAAELALGDLSLPSLSWQEWVFAAREAATRGDYRMAVHCAYWAGIGRLQDAGALAPDRAKTPREYLRALTKSKLLPPEGIAARNQALTDLTTRLEKTWYGYDAATEADFRDSLARLETLGCRLQ